jgi:hypothetical protein
VIGLATLVIVNFGHEPHRTGTPGYAAERSALTLPSALPSPRTGPVRRHYGRPQRGSHTPRCAARCRRDGSGSGSGGSDRPSTDRSNFCTARINCRTSHVQSHRICPARLPRLRLSWARAVKHHRGRSSGSGWASVNGPEGAFSQACRPTSRRRGRWPSRFTYDQATLIAQLNDPDEQFVVPYDKWDDRS